MDSRELTPVAEYREGEIIAPGEETPLPAELVATAKAFQTMARAASTRRAYHRAWTDFDAWCRQHGRAARLVSSRCHSLHIDNLRCIDDDRCIDDLQYTRRKPPCLVCSLH